MDFNKHYYIYKGEVHDKFTPTQVGGRMTFREVEYSATKPVKAEELFNTIKTEHRCYIVLELTTYWDKTYAKNYPDIHVDKTCKLLQTLQKTAPEVFAKIPCNELQSKALDIEGFVITDGVITDLISKSQVRSALYGDKEAPPAFSIEPKE